MVVAIAGCDRALDFAVILGMERQGGNSGIGAQQRDLMGVRFGSQGVVSAARERRGAGVVPEAPGGDKTGGQAAGLKARSTAWMSRNALWIRS